MRGRTGSNVRPIETCKACEIRNVLRVDMIVLCKLHAAASALLDALREIEDALERIFAFSTGRTTDVGLFESKLRDCERESRLARQKARAALAMATGKDGAR